jgi:hypothetical protein
MDFFSISPEEAVDANEDAGGRYLVPPLLREDRLGQGTNHRSGEPPIILNAGDAGGFR